MKEIRIMVIACLFAILPLGLNSQNEDNSNIGKSVTLVVYGTADNEDDAIKIALRSAIEQAFGTFVSANTTIVNDELTKDEIVSVASGNIENYSLITSTKEPDGKSSVSVKATVSIGKLLQFAQSKGATAELAGATFAMNMKIRRLNKKNEYDAIVHMYKKLLKMCDLNLFDFTINTGDPRLVKGYSDFYGVPVTINIIPNKNYQNLVDEFTHTIQALSLTETEAKEYEKANISTFHLFESWNHPQLYGDYDSLKRPRGIVLRNDIFNIEGVKIVDILQDKIVLSSCSFTIKDNIGNCSVPVKEAYASVMNISRGVKYNLNCIYPIFWKQEYRNISNTQVYINLIYGITTSSSNNPSKYFMGNKSEKKLDESQFYKKDWNDFIYEADLENHKAFRKYHEQLFKLDYGVSYQFEIRLYYTEEELSRLNSITIEPTNPKEIKPEVIFIDN